MKFEVIMAVFMFVVQVNYSMKEAICTVCESKEPVICCATSEALYCENCKISVHKKVQSAIHFFNLFV